METETHNTNNLKLSDIESIYDKLQAERKKCMGVEFVTSHLLKDTQTIIKSGNKIYYSPDIRSGEVTVLNIPEPDFFDSPKIDFGFNDEFPQWK